MRGYCTHTFNHANKHPKPAFETSVFFLSLDSVVLLVGGLVPANKDSEVVPLCSFYNQTGMPQLGLILSLM